MPNATINRNTGNIEIRYQRKPPEATRQTLSTAGFRFHGPTETWWAAATNDTLAVAVKVDPDFRPVKTARGKSLKAAKPAKANCSEAAKRAKPNGPAAVWSQVAVGDEVEFRPLPGSQFIPRRGVVRKVTHGAAGPEVKVRASQVQVGGGSRWLQGSSALDSLPMTPAAGTLTIVRPAAKANGNLEEALRDMRKAKPAAKPAAKAPGRPAAKPTTPAKRPAAAGPSGYRVTGQSGAPAPFIDAMKAARAVVRQYGEEARKYHGGRLSVVKASDGSAVASWTVGADGRFHPAAKR